MTQEPRDAALQVLYEIDSRSLDGIPEDAHLSTRSRRLVAGVLEQKDSLDVEIGIAAEGWSLERMPVVDRSILRLGLYELRHERSTPTGVVISEAVRLSREYSTEKSSSFVNGVLAALSKSEPPEADVLP